MLAKIWKKALLAVCIIACIWNVMHKLVNRKSLDTQLKSVQNQTSLVETVTEQIIKQNSATTNQVSRDSIDRETPREEETIVIIN